MNNLQKEKITNLRSSGKSYSAIADKIGLSVNTIKSYCQRNNLKGPLIEPLADIFCRQCSAPIKQPRGKKHKQYCSDMCRMAWWNAHPEAVNHRNTRQVTCLACGQKFEGYGQRERKYCSRTCYGLSKVVR